MGGRASSVREREVGRGTRKFRRLGGGRAKEVPGGSGEGAPRLELSDHRESPWQSWRLEGGLGADVCMD